MLLLRLPQRDNVLNCRHTPGAYGGELILSIVLLAVRIPLEFCLLRYSDLPHMAFMSDMADTIGG